MRFLENKERADVYYSHDEAHYEQVRFENSEDMTNLRIIGCFLGLVAGSEKTEGKEIPPRVIILPSWGILCIVSVAFPRGACGSSPGLGGCMFFLFLHVRVCEF